MMTILTSQTSNRNFNNAETARQRFEVRLTGKQRLGLEILSRKKRCSLSNVVDQLLNKSFKQEKITTLPKSSASPNYIPFQSCETTQCSIKEATQKLWYQAPSDRFVAFALSFPYLLNAYEEELWQLIKSNPYFWQHDYQVTHGVSNKNKRKAFTATPSMGFQALKRERLKKCWDALQEIAKDFCDNNLTVF